MEVVALNIVFNIRTVLAYTIIILFVAIPRLLVHFGLEAQALTDLTSLWATFIILLIAEIIFLWQYIRNWRYLIFALVGAIIISVILTSFFGG